MPFSKTKALADTLVYSILPKISVLASILVLPWISPYLSLDDYGIYGLLVAYISILQIFITAGQSVILQNSYFTHGKHYKAVWRRSYGIMICAGLISSALFAVILFSSLRNELGEKFFIIVSVVSVYFILSPLDTILINYYTLHERAFPFALGAGISGLVSVCVSLVTIRFLKMGYMGWIFSLGSAALFMQFYFAKRIYIAERILPSFWFNRRFLRNALRVGLPLTPHQVSLYILNASDRLMLEYFKVPIRSIGFYSQGYAIGSQGGVFVNGTFQALSKRIQEGFRGETEDDRMFIRKSILAIPLLVSGFLFLIGLWMKEAFFFLFRNPELQEAYPVAIVVLSSFMFWTIYTFFTYPLSIKGQTFSISKISLVAAVINITGNLVLIPRYGIWAALGTTYLSYVIFGFAGLLNKENRTFLNTYVNMYKVSAYLLLINIFLFLLCFLLKDSFWLYKLLCSSIVLLSVAYIFKYRTKLLFYRDPR